jgi:hypothetical protein
MLPVIAHEHLTQFTHLKFLLSDHQSTLLGFSHKNWQELERGVAFFFFRQWGGFIGRVLQ